MMDVGSFALVKRVGQSRTCYAKQQAVTTARVSCGNRPSATRISPSQSVSQSISQFNAGWRRKGVWEVIASVLARPRC